MKTISKADRHMDPVRVKFFAALKNTNGMTEQCMTETLQDLVDNFALFEDWEERYRYLIDIGRALPHLDEALKTDASLVPGCTSRVWLVAEERDGAFFFQADSDAHIVRGLVALLLAAYQGKNAAEIAGVDIHAAFAEIGLDQHLSANRRSGFMAMVERIRGMAVPAC